MRTIDVKGTARTIAERSSEQAKALKAIRKNNGVPCVLYGGAENIYETRKFINAHNLNFNLGNVVKYVVRAGKKDDNTVVQDINKAMTYLQFELERISDDK